MVEEIMVEGQEVKIRNVMMKKKRKGMIMKLKEMGEDIEIIDKRIEGGEDVEDMRVKEQKMKGVVVKKESENQMIDEYKVMEIEEYFEEGEKVMEGIDEMRVKEQDSMEEVERGIEENGVDCKEGEMQMKVSGRKGGKGMGGGKVEKKIEKRIEMSLIVMGIEQEKKVKVDERKMIEKYLKELMGMMEGMGEKIEERGEE